MQYFFIHLRHQPRRKNWSTTSWTLDPSAAGRYSAWANPCRTVPSWPGIKSSACWFPAIGCLWSIKIPETFGSGSRCIWNRPFPAGSNCSSSSWTTLIGWPTGGRWSVRLFNAGVVRTIPAWRTFRSCAASSKPTSAGASDLCCDLYSSKSENYASDVCRWIRRGKYKYDLWLIIIYFGCLNRPLNLLCWTMFGAV